MILKGNQRGGGRALAAHLLNISDNDHVEVHTVSGLVSLEVLDAFVEIEALSRATRCTQPFFSLSLSPPKGQLVVMQDFEDAISQAAEKLGLANQPRVVIFHEKEARRHCHVVFSRIDSKAVKAINLPFYKKRLTELSRELYLVHGWDMPKGLADKSLANPLNFGLKEWGEAKQAKRDPREIKAVFKQCWAQSDNSSAFDAALNERGFWLCRGDRRGFVAIDYKGNIYSLSRWLDVKAPALKAKLGDPAILQSVEERQQDMAVRISEFSKRLMADLELRNVEAMKPLLQQRRRIVERQQRERSQLIVQQKERQEAECLVYATRFRKGLMGLWDWAIGTRKKMRREVERERRGAQMRDQVEIQALYETQMRNREALQRKIEFARKKYQLATENAQRILAVRSADIIGRYSNQEADLSRRITLRGEAHLEYEHDG